MNRFLLALIIFFHTSFADVTKEIILKNTSDFNTEKLNREVKEFENWENRIEQLSKEDNLDEKSINCFFIKEIDFEGNGILSSSSLKNLTKEFIGKNLCSNDLQKIIKKVNNYYIKKGYITTQVFLKQQNISSGIVLITIIEGRVSKIIFGEDETKDRVTNFMLNPVMEGDALNIKDLDQLTENLSSFETFEYKTILDAGKDDGETVLIVKGEQDIPPIIPSINFDNDGQESTGIDRYSVGLTGENLIGIGDIFYAKGTVSFSDNGNKKSLNFGGSETFRYFKLNYDGGYSKYQTTIRNGNGKFISSGTSLNQTTGLSYTFYRSTYAKNVASISLNTTDSKNYINEVLSKVQSRRLSGIEASILNNYFTRYGSAFLKLSYIEGIKEFSSINDKKDLTDKQPHAQYKAYQIYLLLFTGYKPWDISLNSSFQGQFSKTELYSENQYSVGGYYSVRGYKQIASGSTGFTNRNEITKVFWDYLKFGVFFDYGQVSSPLYDKDTLAGTGAFLEARYKRYSVKLTFAEPITNKFDEKGKVYLFVSL